jgi:hypothetical protein
MNKALTSDDQFVHSNTRRANALFALSTIRSIRLRHVTPRHFVRRHRVAYVTRNRQLATTRANYKISSVVLHAFVANKTMPTSGIVYISSLGLDGRCLPPTGAGTKQRDNRLRLRAAKRTGTIDLVYHVVSSRTQREINDCELSLSGVIYCDIIPYPIDQMTHHCSIRTIYSSCRRRLY